MLKLLRADFSRLFKDKLFYILILGMFAFGAAVPIIHSMDASYEWSMDSGLFAYVCIVPIAASLLTALFVGCEYSDGTLRNKIVVGHDRVCIYLSNLIVCTTAALVLCIAYLVPFVCLGAILLMPSTVPVLGLVCLALLGFMVAIAFVAIFTLVSMVCRNRAYTVAICILLAFALLFMGIMTNSALDEPEFYSAYSYTVDGVTQEESASRNPNYLSGTKRKVYEFMYDFTPGGQVIQIVSMKAKALYLLALYDVLIIALSTVCGMLLFKRKDLK